MKKSMLTYVVPAAVALLLISASVVEAKGPPEDVGAMVIERLLGVLEGLAAMLPIWVADFLDALIVFLQGLLVA